MPRCANHGPYSLDLAAISRLRTNSRAIYAWGVPNDLVFGGRPTAVRTPSDATAQLVPQDERAPCDAGADGWQYSADRSKIRLCGATCDAVKADAGGRVDVVLGCPIQGPD